MSWMKQLYLTYDEIAKRSDESNVLMPLAHQYAKAQIEVILKENGELVTINLVEKENTRTLIPVTEASGGRAGLTVAPHPLCDTLSYVVKDFSKYCADEKSKNMAEKKYEAYIQNLKKWCESEYSHVKVRAIYRYLSSGEMLEDLIKNDILHIEDTGTYCGEKIVGQPYEKALVRFKVIMHDLSSNISVEPDMSLVNAYIDFYLANQEGRRDICYFGGTEKVISDNHPKGVVPIAGNAKLVSANDSSGYTFRGRFREAEQACALSYEASQKIHSALSWLVKNQGETIGNSRTFVCWNPQGKKTISLFGDICGFEDVEEDVDVDYGSKFRSILRGYREPFKKDENILVLGLEAATAGRLSITYYNEFSANEFWDRIENWYDICKWKYFNAKRKKNDERAPSFKQIVQCAFGTEKGNFIDVNDKVLKEQSQRLMKCMLENGKMPFDIVNALVNRASTPTAYSYYNRSYLLSTTCAVLRKFYYDMKGEKIAMKLDLNNPDRSYLFGRLLAIYDYAERCTYESSNERDTNAIRLQSAFVNHPMQTWMVLREVIIPYYKKLGSKRSGYFETMISQIVEMIQSGDGAELNKRLKETYLLGYYLQRAELYKKKDEKQEVEENE